MKQLENSQKLTAEKERQKFVDKQRQNTENQTSARHCQHLLGSEMINDTALARLTEYRGWIRSFRGAGSPRADLG